MMFNSKVDLLARYLILIGIFFIPLSPTFSGLITVGSILTLFGGQLREKFHLIFQYKMNYIVILLMVLFTIGVFYNPYGWREGLHHVHKYYATFVVLFLSLPLFLEAQWRRKAVNTLIASAIISGIIYCTQKYHLVPWQLLLHKDFSGLLNSIVYSIFIAFSCFVLLNRLFDEQRFRFYYLLAFLFLTFLLFFVNYERTGMLVFLALVVLFGYQRFGIKGLLLGCFTSALLFLFFYSTSHTMRQQVQKGVVEAQLHKVSDTTSIGLRLTFLKYGLQLVKAHPFFGMGTGLYTVGIGHFQHKVDDTLNNGRVNPENSYLHIALQIGIVGLAVFLLWIATQINASRYLPTYEQRLVQGLIVTMVISNFCIIAFYLNGTSLLYASFLAIFFASHNQITGRQTN